MTRDLLSHSNTISRGQQLELTMSRGTMLFYAHSPSRLRPLAYLYYIWGYDKGAEKSAEFELEKLGMSIMIQGGKEGARNVRL